jgi:hypothetical protein
VTEAEGVAGSNSNALLRVIAESGMNLDKLWMCYFGIGGMAGPLEIEAYLHGLMPLDDHQHAVLAYSVNEILNNLGLKQRVAYRFDVDEA